MMILEFVPGSRERKVRDMQIHAITHYGQFILITSFRLTAEVPRKNPEQHWENI